MTARIAAFIPGASPPLVRTASRCMARKPSLLEATVRAAVTLENNVFGDSYRARPRAKDHHPMNGRPAHGIESPNGVRISRRNRVAARAGKPRGSPVKTAYSCPPLRCVVAARELACPDVYRRTLRSAAHSGLCVSACAPARLCPCWRKVPGPREVRRPTRDGIKQGREVRACAIYARFPPPEIPSSRSVSDQRPFVMYRTTNPNIAEVQISLHECFFL